MSTKGKKKVNRDVNEEDVFQVGRIKEYWVDDYSNVDVKANKKEKIGEQKIFYVLCTKQTTENGEINVYSAIPKQWISSNFTCLLYPPNGAKNAASVEITTRQTEKPISQRTKGSLKSLHFPPSIKRRKTASVGDSPDDFDAQDDPAGNNSDSESPSVQNSARKSESLSLIVASDSETDDDAVGETKNLEAEQCTEPLSVEAQNVSARAEGSACGNSLSTPAGDTIADLDLPVSTVVSPIINSDDFMKALESIVERVVHRQLQPFRQLVLKEFAKIHRRLDQVHQPNAIENATKHLVYHAQQFQQQFNTLPCNTLEEVEALNTVTASCVKRNWQSLR
ncbi:hypothetical protein GHT06_018599 [Daphnia sinensis]|uniref:Uncharacterized protein n=1 Tax=Daphnia sinensis TaxID=1820382 RepID=A0AAD5KMQ8_9CRUS|nr:hypothetical protein GHT06_018599 [Daphnia sinensis]